MSNRNKILIIMSIISVLILLSGIANCFSLYHELTAPVNASQGITVDGADFTGFAKLFAGISSAAISILIMAFTFIVICIQWAVYGIVIWIRHFTKKPRERINE